MQKNCWGGHPSGRTAFFPSLRKLMETRPKELGCVYLGLFFPFIFGSLWSLFPTYFCMAVHLSNAFIPCIIIQICISEKGTWKKSLGKYSGHYLDVAHSTNSGSMLVSMLACFQRADIFELRVSWENVAETNAPCDVWTLSKNGSLPEWSYSGHLSHKLSAVICCGNGHNPGKWRIIMNFGL